jgi:chromosome segregation ATPase
MLKSIALWLCPTLVDPDFIDSANQQLSHQKQTIADLNQEVRTQITRNQTLRDALDSANVTLADESKRIDETKLELQAAYSAWKAESEEKNAALSKTNDACNAEIDRVMILSGRLNQIDNALKKRIVAHNPKHTMRTVVDRQNAILDEISNLIGPTQK